MRHPIPTLTVLLLSGLLAAPARPAPELRFPWRDAGLDERQAAAHLLDRFAYGARPGDVDRVVAMGLETWFLRQLDGHLPDPAFDRLRRELPALDWPVRKIAATYPTPGRLLAQAIRDGVISKDEARGDERRETTERLREYGRSQGMRPKRELMAQLMVQKLYRAMASENQLCEVLTDFWFNHFNVSITSQDTQIYVLPYERDAIRPHVTGTFRELLEATAKHPAMLLYLDNARSQAAEDATKTFDRERERERLRRSRRGFGRGFGMGMDMESGMGLGRARERDPALDDRRPRGLNENYGRELLELHTLGVDGGYTQDDVVAVARAFTGWTLYPPGPRRDDVEERISRARRIPSAGFVFEDEFIFRADAHDADPKHVLGHLLPAGRGIEDGLEVLDIVASHPATARHLARKLAVRFVADEPPPALVERLAATFERTGGDLRQVMIALARSPEFWAPEARRQKIKSPFELAVSALRILDADVEAPRDLIEWIKRMGQPLYAYQAPTGYPDGAAAWVNTGALLQRMNFGLELATGRVGGVRVDLPALAGHREPESLDAALRAYVPLLLPERDPEPTIAQLDAVIHDPALAEKLQKRTPARQGRDAFDGDDWEDLFSEDPPWWRRWLRPEPRQAEAGPLGHVVGVILGSPEFQRR